MHLESPLVSGSLRIRRVIHGFLALFLLVSSVAVAPGSSGAAVTEKSVV
jgi:hypothetical protein